jgi:hypothetical protein
MKDETDSVKIHHESIDCDHVRILKWEHGTLGRGAS